MMRLQSDNWRRLFMARYVPTTDQVNELRGELMEVLNDYVLMAVFNGISGPDDVYRVFFSMLNGLRGDEDLCREPSFLTMQREEAVNSARHLLQVLEEIDILATDSLGLADAWPRWVDTRWEYSGVHERFKPLRELALVWKIDLTAAVAKARGGRRPRFKAPEEVLDWLRPYVEMCTKETPPLNPSIELVAGFMGCHPNNIRYHLHNPPDWDWSDWEAVLTDLSKK
jgi:hypothetical protein